MNVNFEQAKALKEAGFDVPCNKYYNEQGVLCNDFMNDYNQHDYEISVPTIHATTTWIREVKGLHVYVEYAAGEWFPVIKDMTGAGKHELASTDTHDTALSAAITHALTLLTDKK